MAEIKSTMELVMEKLSKLEEKDDSSGYDSEALIKDGMRLGASFMKDDSVNLLQGVKDRSEKEGRYVKEGIGEALLRNIFLPRENDQQKTAEKAMEGLIKVSGGNQEFLQIFGDMKKIIGQFLSQREDLRNQLKQAFAQQMLQMEQNLAEQTGMNMHLEPEQHPKFQEEWERVVGDLNSQYGNAIDQYKEHLRNFLKA